MTQTAQSTPFIRHVGTRAVLALAAVLCLGCLLASRADAAYEQVGCFAGSCTPILPPPKSPSEFPEETQLGGVGGMAVNYTGAGGVPAGTVYAALTPAQIAMFEPSADGGMKFVMAWEVEYEGAAISRCGPTGELPDGTTVHPNCTPQVDANAGNVDVDVDQATGNVYAQRLTGSVPAGKPAIVVYPADGGEVITRFGEIAKSGKTTAETPSQIHGVQAPGGIAVNSAGEVYVSDVNQVAGAVPFRRIMKFKPKVPGNFTDYEYAGASSDVAAGFLPDGPPRTRPVADASGHIYAVAEENTIEEYDPANPADPPICTFTFEAGGIKGMTVNPANGEVFFSSSRPPRRVYRLGPCDEGAGEFTGIDPEPEAIAFKPPRDHLWALTFDPVRQVDAARPPGVLYAGAPSAIATLGTGEPGQSALGYIFAHSKEAPPAVEAESFDHVSATSALLHASIDTQGFKAHYAFQYLTLAEYEANEAADRFAGAKEAPAGGADLPGAVGAQVVGTTLLGLAPDTDYRFRVVATSHCAEDEEEKVCEGAGEAVGFHTFALEAPGLPDKRAYELVSPFDKHGGQVFPASPLLGSCNNGTCNKPGQGGGRFPMQSTPDGEAVVYEGSAFGEGEGAPNENEYLARRDAKTGWQSTTLTPPLLFSRGGQGYKAFSTDLTQGVLEQVNPSPALSPEAPAEYANLYSQPSSDPLALSSFLAEAPPQRPAGGFAFNVRYAGASADLSRVFFEANDALTTEDPGIAPAAPEVSDKEFNLYEWQRETGELHLVNVLPGNATASPNASFGIGSAHAISADGSRVFWSDQAGQVYVREDGDVTKSVPDSGKFLAAAIDGSKVLLANGHLVDLGDEEPVTDLTAEKGGFRGLVGQSDDLSHVYFVDTEVLSEEENDQGAKAQSGEFNLYAWSEGTTRFVATLVSEDNSVSGNTVTGLSRDWWPSPSARTAEASPHGRWLAFLSRAPLTGYDNTGPASVRCLLLSATFIPGPCQEAFLYDSATGKLTCASCNPSGASPLGWSQLPLLENNGSSLPQPRYLTDQGRLYFDSGDSLTLFDTNEGVQDVYQWEPNEVGGCKREAGCINLISAGSEPVDSNFVTIDEDGSNVFFTTRDELVLKDKDELLDLYDAREDGGIPAESEVARGECQGEACQPPVSAPNDPTPGSSTFEGAGNVNEKKAAKKHSKKKKHVKKHKSKKNNKRAAKHNRGGVK